MRKLATYHSFVFISLTLFLTSCGAFDYSPHDLVIDQDETNLIAKGIKEIEDKALDDDTIKFIFTGDTQMAFDEVEKFVRKANTIGNIDFTLVCGDLTQFGLKKEFVWMHNQLKKLNHPYIPVIGNHDFVATGPQIFKKMYGPFDYSFKVGKFKFVAINTNSIEFGFDGTVPNISWLEDELSDTSGIENIYVYSHIMPWDEGFDPNLELPFANALSKSKVKYSFHGHWHNYYVSNPYGEDVTYIVTGSTGRNSCILIKLWNNGKSTSYEQIFF